MEGLRERFLPECAFRGWGNTKLPYAVLAAAALHGGTEPDLLDEVAWWQADDFWQYALFGAVACIRAAASRAGVPVRRACQDLARRPGHPRHDDQVGTQRRRSSDGGAAAGPRAGIQLPLRPGAGNDHREALPDARGSGGCCTMTFQIRHLSPADYPLVISVIDQWWGGRPMAGKLPRLFFEHFTDTSFAAERDRRLAGFLAGFISQSPDR